VGRTDIEDALKRLEKLSHDEALMAAVQVLKVTDSVADGAPGAFWLVPIANVNDHPVSNATDRGRSL
jgi:hypothetical protein